MNHHGVTAGATAAWGTAVLSHASETITIIAGILAIGWYAILYYEKFIKKPPKD